VLLPPFLKGYLQEKQESCRTTLRDNDMIFFQLVSRDVARQKATQFHCSFKMSFKLEIELSRRFSWMESGQNFKVCKKNFRPKRSFVASVPARRSSRRATGSGSPPLELDLGPSFFGFFHFCSANG
jgi:hypothetical protein